MKNKSSNSTAGAPINEVEIKELEKIDCQFAEVKGLERKKWLNG